MPDYYFEVLKTVKLNSKIDPKEYTIEGLTHEETEAILAIMFKKDYIDLSKDTIDIKGKELLYFASVLDREDDLPTNKPITYVTKLQTTKNKEFIANIFKNDYVKYIIIGIIVTLIGIFLTAYFQHKLI